MSESESSTRRSVVKKMGAGAAALVACVGSASATKDHYIRFEPRDGASKADWAASGPDGAPNTENFESGDDITAGSGSWTADGTVDDGYAPRYDEIQFNGDLSNLDYNVDPEVRVIVDGTIES